MSLRVFLANARAHLESSLHQKKPLHFVIGNESADLDSIISTLLYAYFRSSSSSTSPRAHTTKANINPPASTSAPATFSRYYIPILNIPSADISIRPELLALLPQVGLEERQLITLSELPPPPYTDRLPAIKTSWTLVDHNSLQGSLGEAYRERVVGCIDHHDDENKVPSSEAEREGEPRVVEVTGSCTSLVINHFQSAWNAFQASSPGASTQALTPENSQSADDSEYDAQLAKLALSSILVDTSNLQNEDKTTEHDRRAVAYLETKLGDKSFDRRAWFRMLQIAKRDLDGLTTDDVLRKDYKEWLEGGRKLGVSSVVKPLEWLSEKARIEAGKESIKGGFGQSLRKFVEARDLAVYAIMTTSTSKEGEFERELLLWIRDHGAKGMMQSFIEKAGEKLGLEKWQKGDAEVVRLYKEQDQYQVWQQREVENSRKQVTPLLRAAMASL